MRAILMSGAVLAMVIATSATGWAGSPKSLLRPVGHIVQKGHVAQKGHVVQKGKVVETPCQTCDACGPVYGTRVHCCLPPILPAIARGIDCILTKVLCHHRCAPMECDVCAPKTCGPILPGLLWSKRFHHAKGCNDCCDGSAGSIENLPDPFLDDPELPDMTNRDRRLYDLWNMPAPARPARTAARSQPTEREPTRAVPASFSVLKAKPIELKQEKESAPVRRTIRSASSDREIEIPTNPLRD